MEETEYLINIKFEHKGYTGNIEYSEEDKVFYGSIQGIDDVICYDGDSIYECCKYFIEAVEDYISIKGG